MIIPQTNKYKKLAALLSQLEVLGTTGQHLSQVPNAIQDLANAKLLRRSDINEMYENYVGVATGLLTDISRLAEEAETVRAMLLAPDEEVNDG